MEFILISLAYASLIETDLFSFPQYQVKFTENQGFIPKGEIISLEQGKIICVLPSVSNPETIPQTPNIEKAVSELRNLPCLYQIFDGNYWAYEICAFKQVIQFHPNKKGEQNSKSQYVLGKAAAKTISTIETEVVNGLGVNYLLQKWEGGSKCEINGQSRTCRVEYYCSNEEKIASVREVSTCNYLVVVHTPRLCLELVSAESLSLTTIHCTSDDVELFGNWNEYMVPKGAPILNSNTKPASKVEDAVDNFDKLVNFIKKASPKVEAKVVYLNDLNVDTLLNLFNTQQENDPQNADIEKKIKDIKELEKELDKLVVESKKNDAESTTKSKKDDENTSKPEL